jgi:hypothetical protein
MPVIYAMEAPKIIEDSHYMICSPDEDVIASWPTGQR